MPSLRAPQLAALVVGATVAVAACGGGDAPATTTTATRPAAAKPAPAVPVLCGPLRARVAGRVDAPEATELSGLARSATQPGVLWAHNDSGDRARVFALRTDGSLIASLDVPGAEATDWEDIAIGPGGDLLLGDIGDNDAERADVSVYRVPEPKLAAKPSATAPATRYTLTYPDGAQNAETLIADPRTGEIVIVTKAFSGRSGVYAASVRGATTQTLRRVGTIELGLGGLATAGDVSTDGRIVAVRTYTALSVWKRRPGVSLARTIVDGDRCTGQVALGREGQGEALALAADGRSFFTAPEGAAPELRRYAPRK
ncbi:hypothetical protein DSM104299_04173 [Baekduia alba]|uniref:hypothetical protein n=1 Tax=Baekduia alba TaxID=2997333 RepID=UPI0023411F4D|nr:hypothetical protein [Baekduia alba]WCB95429.1 hypothetical protein DSM104299_04173 [Baekduia alba]